MSTFLTAEWRKLIMAQYEVSPVALTPWLPRGLELDLFQDRCYVSLVGFLFDRVRLKGVPIPFHTRFEEVNLRFYVKLTPSEGPPQRGVVFIREFVPRAAITFVANTFYEEPYATLPTHSSIASNPQSLEVQYSWKHSGRWHSLGVETSPTPQPIAADSEEEFITEHYWGYTRRRDGSTSAYEVQHPRWETYPILRHAIDVDFATLYGKAFAALSSQEPTSVLLSEGSPVSVQSDTGERIA